MSAQQQDVTVIGRHASGVNVESILHVPGRMAGRHTQRLKIEEVIFDLRTSLRACDDLRTHLVIDVESGVSNNALAVPHSLSLQIFYWSNPLPGL